MPKKIRKQPIYIAPEIVGYLDEQNVPHVEDERYNRKLSADVDDDKITIYERQVNGWFLEPAGELLKNKNNEFLVLMICLSYLEGVEQYRRGEYSNGNSKSFFVAAINRIYPQEYDEVKLKEFYADARCGLFHTGMIKGKTVIDSCLNQVFLFEDESTIRVNHRMLLEAIKQDFNEYVNQLRINQETRVKFSKLFNVLI